MIAAMTAMPDCRWWCCGVLRSAALCSMALRSMVLRSAAECCIALRIPGSGRVRKKISHNDIFFVTKHNDTCYDYNIITIFVICYPL
jgi:hypothetical protein